MHYTPRFNLIKNNIFSVSGYNAFGKTFASKRIICFYQQIRGCWIRYLTFYGTFHLVFIASIEGKYSRMDHIKFVEDSF